MLREGIAPSLEALLERRSRRLRVVVLGLSLGCSVGLGVTALIHLIPPRPYGIADDYRVFYSAAQMLASGHSPYSASALRLVEQSVWRYPHLQPNLDLYAYLPVTATVLEPFAKLPFWVSYGLFTAVGVVAAGVVISLLARDLGWRHDRLLMAAVLVSWVGLLGGLSGNLDYLLLAVLGGAMLLAWHRRPLPAGLVMGLIWLKPDLVWPAAVFLLLALWPDRARCARFLAGFLSITALCLLASPGLLPAWWGGVVRFGRTVAHGQYDLAGLPSLAAAAPARLGLGSGVFQPGTIAVLGLALAGMGVVAWWMLTSNEWRRLTEVGRIAWGVALPLGIWLAATPYAHTNDDLLLLPLLMLTVGRDARRIHGLGLWLSLAMVALLLLVWPGGVVPWEPAVVVWVLFGVLVWRRRTDARLTGFGAGLALLCLALLPGVSPFHLLLVGLTPVAAAVLLVEGSRTCWMEVGGEGTGPAYATEPA